MVDTNPHVRILQQYRLWRTNMKKAGIFFTSSFVRITQGRIDMQNFFKQTCWFMLMILLAVFVTSSRASAQTTFSYKVIYPDNEEKKFAYPVTGGEQKVNLKNSQWSCKVSQLSNVSNPFSDLNLECSYKGSKEQPAVMTGIVCFQDNPARQTQSVLLFVSQRKKIHRVDLQCNIR